MTDILLSCSFGAITLLTTPVFAGDSVILYTPFTKISVPPGQTITYNIQAINESDELQKLDLSVYGVSGSWSYDLKSGNYEVKQLAVLPGENKNIALTVMRFVLSYYLFTRREIRLI